MDILGYALTLVYALLFAGLVLSVAFYRKDLAKALRGKITRNSIIALFFILLFFIVFSAVFVHPLEQLYFDENIYQGIAINMLKNGNAFWCQYGSAYLGSCGSSVVYHDPVGWSFYIAIAFGIFGIGTATAYGMQMLSGALLIMFTFLLGSYMKGSRTGMLSALAISVMPEVIIWSRAQAAPDLAFAAFATLSFFFFVLFAENKKSSALLPFLLSLGIAVYMRTEGALLILLFIILYFAYGSSSTRQNFRNSIKWLKNLVNKDERSLIYILAFAVLMVPQAYYISGQLANPQFGQSSAGLFSVANFKSNAPANIEYFLGSDNSMGLYPAAFPAEITVLAVIGIAAAALASFKHRKNLPVIIALGLWFLAYFFFYAFFYAGSATYGVDSRMMLQMHPQLMILSAIGIVEIAGFLGSDADKRKGHAGKRRRRKLLPAAPYAAFLIVIAYVFVQFLPQATVLPSDAPQQSVILPATSFIQSNYSSVPSNCLVFSFTPDIWYENGRAAAQIGYIGSTNQSFVNFTKGYRCFVLDYGYWCLVPPYSGTTCPDYLKTYNTSVIATERISSTNNASFYLLRNYSS